MTDEEREQLAQKIDDVEITNDNILIFYSNNVEVDRVQLEGGMNNGTGMMTAKMYVDEQGKVIPCSIHADGSIGFTYYCCRAINSSL